MFSSSGHISSTTRRSTLGINIHTVGENNTEGYTHTRAASFGSGTAPRPHFGPHRAPSAPSPSPINVASSNLTIPVIVGNSASQPFPLPARPLGLDVDILQASSSLPPPSPALLAPGRWRNQGNISGNISPIHSSPASSPSRSPSLTLSPWSPFLADVRGPFLSGEVGGLPNVSPVDTEAELLNLFDLNFELRGRSPTARAPMTLDPYDSSTEFNPGTTDLVPPLEEIPLLAFDSMFTGTMETSALLLEAGHERVKWTDEGDIPPPLSPLFDFLPLGDEPFGSAEYFFNDTPQYRLPSHASPAFSFSGSDQSSLIAEANTAVSAAAGAAGPSNAPQPSPQVLTSPLVQRSPSGANRRRRKKTPYANSRASSRARPCPAPPPSEPPPLIWEAEHQAGPSQTEHGDVKIVGSIAGRAAARGRRKNPGKFSCSLCPADFTAKHNLTYHMKSHNNEKEWPCAKCKAAFVTPHVAKRHEKKCFKEPS
ncbi:hypothetical protein MKEN_00795400 [Mycena kentingensis (nom. inval.)]|nr:hypothetical protein MKEN_00795400 [Mycena kentingensis (nom. inval.)]